MKSVKHLPFAAACVVLLATAASAQMGMGMRSPMPRGLFNPVVGSGAAYETTSADGRKTNIEFALVGKEFVNGKDGYWMEWTMNLVGGDMIMKVLMVPGDTTAIARSIMQMPGRPPMEMPQQMTSRMNNPNVQSDIKTVAEDVGSESVTVPAGTFTCEHYRMKDGSGDTWLSSKVAPLGVVKHQGKDSTMVLTKVISDAKDKITGVPEPFNPMQMIEQPPQQ
jgi:hypothetical protein